VVLVWCVAGLANSGSAFEKETFEIGPLAC
jgi:hypothetical protein